MKNVSHSTFFNNTFPLPYSVFPEQAKQGFKSVEDIFHSPKCQLTALCLFIPHFHSRLCIRTSVLHAGFWGKGLRWLSYHYKQFLPLFTHATIKYPCTYHHGYTSASQGRTAEFSSALGRAGVNTDCRQSQKVALYLVWSSVKLKSIWTQAWTGSLLWNSMSWWADKLSRKPNSGPSPACTHTLRYKQSLSGMA